MSKEEKLVGVWKLLEYKLTYGNGEVIYPFGERAVGYIMYTICNHMCVQIMRNHRSKCSTEYYSNITTEEKLEIADNFICYMGKYQILNDTVIHYPEVSSFTNYLNIPQNRQYKFSGNNLALSSSFPAEILKNEFNSYLNWEKIQYSEVFENLLRK